MYGHGNLDTNLSHKPPHVGVWLVRLALPQFLVGVIQSYGKKQEEEIMKQINDTGSRKHSAEKSVNASSRTKPHHPTPRLSTLGQSKG